MNYSNDKPKKLFSRHKILRDLAHGYINLTDFDVEIIDTPRFQRLKDIRQLTCQHVYPSARHTRFEHSLGVMELTRRALEHLNRNGYLTAPGKNSPEGIIKPYLDFATSAAALLHDVGHCPFSHLGEQQLDKEELGKVLLEELKKINVTWDINEIPGARHEWMSCIIVIDTYKDDIEKAYSLIDGAPSKDDFNVMEHIVRCIIGKKYNDDVPVNEAAAQEKAIRNVTIQLINAEAIDMDKLDYIMRDSLYTGVSVPGIDTDRLFNNMYLSRKNEIIYTSKAVPVLQTIIETRDNLYMWVYNHHTTIYTDFLFYYIFRRLYKNYDTQIKATEKDDAEKRRYFPGAMSCKYFFSPDAIMNVQVSDSDIIQAFSQMCRESPEEQQPDNAVRENADASRLRAIKLIENWRGRRLLKPWWKTIYEYQNFMNTKYRGDVTRANITKWICGRIDSSLAPEFRSMTAKTMIALTKQKKQNGTLKKELHDGDFFIVDRSNKFYGIASIEKIQIFLHENEIISKDKLDVYTEGEYYEKLLNKLIPQRDYSSLYDSDCFYIYLRRYEELDPITPEQADANDARAFYDEIEKLFVIVTTELGNMKIAEFNQFCEKCTNEEHLLDYFSKIIASHQ